MNTLKAMGLIFIWCVSVSSLSAQQYNLEFSVVGTGGSVTTVGQDTLILTLGQPLAGNASVDSNLNSSGFLYQFSGGPIGASIGIYSVINGWNMVSVPAVVPDYRAKTLFALAISKAFFYEGSYRTKDTLENGYGYWLKFSGDHSVLLAGTAITRDTITVANNWNMIGCLSSPTRTSNIAPLDSVTLVTNFWGYRAGSGYFKEDTLKPGNGYWIKVHNTGRLVLTTDSMAMDPSISSKPPMQSTHQANGAMNLNIVNSLIIQDASGAQRSLYFSLVKNDVEGERWEMPPAAFEGDMDVRFATNRMLEVADAAERKDVRIDVSSADYPLTVTWMVKDNTGGVKLLVDNKEIDMKITGKTQILNPKSQIKLSLGPSFNKELPKEIALHQNFPNPFNPTTTIRYELPKDARVTLTVYDVLGREVTRLVNEIQSAGFKSVLWDASLSASGVYFYRLTAHPIDGRRLDLSSGQTAIYTDVKRMLLLR